MADTTGAVDAVKKSGLPLEESQIIADLIQFVENLLLGLPFSFSITIPKEAKTFQFDLFGNQKTISISEAGGVLSLSETPS